MSPAAVEPRAACGQRGPPLGRPPVAAAGRRGAGATLASRTEDGLVSGTSILVGLVSSQAGKMCALVSSTTKEDGRREEVVGLVGSQASKMCAVVSTNVVRMPEEVVRGLACGRLLSPHSLNPPPSPPSRSSSSCASSCPPRRGSSTAMPREARPATFDQL